MLKEPLLDESKSPMEIKGNNQAKVNKPVKGSARLVELDLLRGLIMMIMIWDHNRDFMSDGDHPVFAAYEAWQGPLATYDGNIGLWLNRFLPAMCAPGFFLLMGVGMGFFHSSRRKKGWTEGRIFFFFFTRGIVLLATEKIVNFANYAYAINQNSWASHANSDTPVWLLGFNVFQVMTALGWSMIFVACLVPAVHKLNSIWLIYPRSLNESELNPSFKDRILYNIISPLSMGQALGIATSLLVFILSNIVILHFQNKTNNLYEIYQSDESTQDYFVAYLILPTFFKYIQVDYPMMPWCGIAMLGLSASYYLMREEKDEPVGRWSLRKSSACLSFILFILFLLVRLSFGSFGNLRGYSREKLLNNDFTPVPEPYSATAAFIFFFTLCKYPPSIAYTTLELSINLGLLSLITRVYAILAEETNIEVDYVNNNNAINIPNDKTNSNSLNINVNPQNAGSNEEKISKGVEEKKKSENFWYFEELENKKSEEEKNFLASKIIGFIFYPLLVFGRVPLFYYVLHFLSLGLLGSLVHGLGYDGVDFQFLPLIWFGLLIYLFFPCLAYLRFKEKTSVESIWRLF